MSAAASGPTRRSACAPTRPITQRRHGGEQPDGRAAGADLGFDFRSDATRIDGDIGYLRRDVSAFQGSIFLAAGVQLPPAPYASNSSYQPWERLQANDLYGALRFEHDITPWPHRLHQGRRQAQQLLVGLPQPEHRQLQRQHDDPLRRAVPVRTPRSLSAETGLRGIFNTGPIKHEAALVGDYSRPRPTRSTIRSTIPTPPTSTIRRSSRSPASSASAPTAPLTRTRSYRASASSTPCRSDDACSSSSAACASSACRLRTTMR